MQPYATQTPGVYLNELNAFPNSIVEVATAIPAFIGYTQTASYKGKDLSNKPVRVESLQEFQTFFGAGFPQQFSLTPGVVAPPSPLPATPAAVTLRFAANNVQYTLQPTATQSNLYYLYNAICLFYLNGGSTCYIISIGSYDGSPANKTDFEDALGKLEFEQDPTMILCPDALRLSADEYAEVMQEMLAHCAKVQSRVALFDLYHGAMTDPLLLDIAPTPIDEFRNAVQDNLNYGVAYFPWVKTTVVSSTDVTFLNLDSASLTLLESILNPIPSSTYQAISTAAATATAAAATALANVTTATGQAKTDAATATTDAATAKTDAAAIGSAQGAAAVAAATATAIASAETAANSQQTAETSAALALAAITASNQAAAAATAANNLLASIEASVPTIMAAADTAATAATTAAAAADAAATASPVDQEKLVLAQQQAVITSAAAEAAYAAVDAAISQAAGTKQVTVLQPSNVPGVAPTSVNIFAYAQTLQASVVPGLNDPAALKAKRLSVHNALGTAFPDYARTIQAITDFLNTLPVAPAMAGVYTAVDNNRGVWKAPANVGLNAVTMPTLRLNDQLQANLNVDAATGKSINAIRYFNGMGTQVWGARTLDGNSDDWRYVNVRRTLIMIEQSVKLATRTYVFEPNNANTWVTVQSMINSFLLNLWKQGALFGTVPAEAYSVSVGVGTTMTTDDVLQGIMRVLVRVSLVRPAEFILLTFEQEMPGA